MHYIPHDWLEMGKELVTVYAALAVYNSLLEALPVPKPEERWYGAVYKFFHVLGVNVGKLRRNGRNGQNGGVQ